MPLSPELVNLKSRIIQAQQFGASFGRAEMYLQMLGASPTPEGMSLEQHLLDTLETIDQEGFRAERPTKPDGKRPKLPKNAPRLVLEAPAMPVKAVEPAPAPPVMPEPVAAAQTVEQLAVQLETALHGEKDGHDQVVAALEQAQPQPEEQKS